ncbi:polyprenyl synthetase family protein [Acinetobacter rathckeae]|uniref:polyprenyl synthetase family protein n=1 Tax=Acinetobacter rathckeae TaxID=2605272 RepID=UPI0018A30403|nr:farnesyl diphosphate synthase [Acinetobacter rathckeae]MBF7686819.1 polyprenyl synthetase family protein [Acinetobacter rathckeae]MBF7695649.1 polyprenyl synthetase family protein [Acinetobacter rathckeae]
MPSVFDVLHTTQKQIQNDLAEVLQIFELPEPLQRAVHHSVMLGGKRIRPALCYAVAKITTPNMHWSAVRRAAVAVELIHCYSLVHDDLPCMDNDALRRGQPTCHIAFGEDTALLAGDVLQSMAYEVLTSQIFDEDASALSETIALKQVRLLAQASSAMVSGQVLDLQAEGMCIDQQMLEKIHKNKTGALIQAAVEMSAVTQLESSSQQMQALKTFAQAIGLAFQVQDDILDITAETAVLGKTAGKDVQVDKSTYPALMGLEPAQQYATQLHEQALSALEIFGNSVQDLHAITQFLWQRQN